MSETPRQQLKNTLRDQISARSEIYCKSIDSPVEFGGSGPFYAEKIRAGVVTIIKQILKDLDKLPDTMTPTELLRRICARTLHNIETCLLHINWPNDIKFEIRRQEKEIREHVFQIFHIRPWTDDETALATVTDPRLRPKRDNTKIRAPQSKPATTQKPDNDDGMPAYGAYAKNCSPIRRVSIYTGNKGKQP